MQGQTRLGAGPPSERARWKQRKTDRLQNTENKKHRRKDEQSCSSLLNPKTRRTAPRVQQTTAQGLCELTACSRHCIALSSWTPREPPQTHSNPGAAGPCAARPPQPTTDLNSPACQQLAPQPLKEPPQALPQHSPLDLYNRFSTVRPLQPAPTLLHSQSQKQCPGPLSLPGPPHRTPTLANGCARPEDDRAFSEVPVT